MTTNLLEMDKRLTAWNAAKEIPGSPHYRIDCDGRMICWSEYGKNSLYGWHIDHIIPTAIGGIMSMGNTRARHWKGNTSAGGFLGSVLREAR